MAEEIKTAETVEEVPAKKKTVRKTAAKKTTAEKKTTTKKTAKAASVKEEAKVEEAPKAEAAKLVYRPAIIKDFSIIKHIIVTEETQRLREEENALVFAVDKKADKLEIKAAVQAIFQGKVKSVNTMNLMPKTRRVGRYSGKLPAYKKAIVRFDSSFDLAKVTDAVASEERKANAESDEK